MYQFKAGATGKTVYVKLVDATTFLGKTGLVFSDLNIMYVLAGALAVAATEATLAAANSAWSSGGFKEVDAANCPGLYRFDVPDAALATGPFVILTFKATNVKDEALVIALPAYDPADGVRLGLTALPNAAAGTNTGLPLVGTQVPNASAGAANGLVVNGANAGITANITGNLSGSVGSVAGAVGSVTGNVGGNVAGSVGSVTGNVGGNVAGSVGSVTSTVNADVKKINAVPINGDGVTTPFGP